jgi:GNAT superfamily N-acetyltransferase
MTGLPPTIGTAPLQVLLERPDTADARWCLQQYFEELAQRFDSGFDPARSNPARDDEMTPPLGLFVVARRDGRPVGCGALKRKNESTGEIKRMWTAPTSRGQGVARAVLQTLEALARTTGLSTVQLETNRALVEAQALYRTHGFREVVAFNDEPYAHHWFQKQL